MTGVVVVVLVVLAAVSAWLCTRASATAQMAALHDQIARLKHEVRALTTEATRARERAAQVERDAATWAAGWQQGREDVFTVVPLLAAANDTLSGSGAPSERAADRSQ